MTRERRVGGNREREVGLRALGSLAVLDGGGAVGVKSMGGALMPFLKRVDLSPYSFLTHSTAIHRFILSSHGTRREWQAGHLFC